jgi:hypothetical protein
MSATNGPGPGTIDKFPIPGVSQKGAAGDAAPDSVLGRLRAAHEQERLHGELAVDLPPVQGMPRRVRYGVLSLDDMEATDTDEMSPVDASLKLMARAVKAIEVLDEEDDRWLVLEDDLGPVTFDDRYARLLRWDRPGDDFTYTTRQIYDAVFGGSGIAIGAHIAKVVQFMAGGEVDIEALLGEGLTASPTRPGTRSRSG